MELYTRVLLFVSGALLIGVGLGMHLQHIAGFMGMLMIAAGIGLGFAGLIRLVLD